MEQAKQPPRDTRYKTEDVTSTKGLSFKDFGLTQEVQLVRLLTLLIAIGNLRNGLRKSITYPRRGNPTCIKRLEHSRKIQERNRKDCLIRYTHNLEDRHLEELDPSISACTNQRACNADFTRH